MVWPITEDIKIPTHWPLAKDKIRFAGDAVAVVVAETREQAEDAAEVVSVEATELPAVTDLEEAAKDEVVHPRRPRHQRRWCTGATAAAGDQSVFESAPVIVEETLHAATPDPERDRAPRLSRLRHPGRMDECTLVSAPPRSRTSRRWRLAIVDRHPAVEVPDHRSRRGRWVRLEAERLRRGGARPRPRAERSGRPVKWIETPPGELRRHDPRPRGDCTTARWPAPTTARSSA